MGVTYDTSSMTPTMRGRLDRHLAQYVRFGGEVLTRGALYARATGVSTVADGKGTGWLDIPTEGSITSGVVVPRMVVESWQRSAMCRECGVSGGHGMVHTRYGNGGGGNRPCSKSDG